MTKVLNYENYTINRLGYVTNSKGNKIATRLSNSGYLQVNLWKNNKGKSFYLHRLLAIHFIPNPNNYEFVNHIDGDKFNNAIDNLEWCTKSQNAIHAIVNGLKVYSNRITKEEFIEILYKVINNGMSYLELSKEYPYKVPFMSTKVKQVAIELGKEVELKESLNKQALKRMSNRDEFGRIKGSVTTTES